MSVVLNSFKNRQTFLLCVLTLARVVFADDLGNCINPNGELGNCVPVSTCQVIISAISTRNSSAVEFAQQSVCGYKSEPLVCCGTSGYPFSPHILPSVQRETILKNREPKDLPDRTICGLESLTNRIFGGNITFLDEFPWMAALEYKSKLTGENAGIRCSGSVINNRYVLTAAHCIISQEFKLISVWLGDWRLSTDPDCLGPEALGYCADPVRKFKVKEEIPHPFYSLRTKNNDIALLELETDIEYTDYIRPICLPPENLPNPEIHSKLIVAGWGSTETSDVSDVKMKVTVPLVSLDDCKSKLRLRQISSNQLCAGGEPGRDACTGDSGGPLMRIYEDKPNQQTQWYLEGVVSFGTGCGRAQIPAVYTRVTRYVKWIIKNISEEY